MKTKDGKLYVVGGASRSGKTAWVKQQVEPSKRVCAWDPEDQWSQLPGWIRVTSRVQLAQVLQRKGPLKVAFVAGGKLAEEFDFWARVVFYALRYVEPLDTIGEELADVSNPSRAPAHWGILLRRGLKRGGNIYAISQRWAEADKTAMGNASAFVIFRQATGPDAAYMARYTRVPVADINALPALSYVFYDTGTQKIDRGQLSF